METISKPYLWAIAALLWIVIAAIGWKWRNELWQAVPENQRVAESGRLRKHVTASLIGLLLILPVIWIGIEYFRPFFLRQPFLAILFGAVFGAGINLIIQCLLKSHQRT